MKNFAYTLLLLATLGSSVAYSQDKSTKPEPPQVMIQYDTEDKSGNPIVHTSMYPESYHAFLAFKEALNGKARINNLRVFFTGISHGCGYRGIEADTKYGNLTTLDLSSVTALCNGKNIGAIVEKLTLSAQSDQTLGGLYKYLMQVPSR